MRRGTTQTLTFNTGLDLSRVDLLDISFAQHDEVVVSKSLEDCTIDGQTIIVNLSEDDTLKFDSRKNPVQMQLRIGIGEARLASGQMYMKVEPILKGGRLK